MNGGALSAPSGNKSDAGGVKEEFAVRSSLVRSSVARSRVGRSSVVPNPVSYRTPVVNGVLGIPIEMRMVGRRWIEPDLISH